MSDEYEGPEKGSRHKKRKYLTNADKKKLLEKFYQIPQPCTQRKAAALLNISQATFSRLIGDRYAKKINEAIGDDEDLVEHAPRQMKRMSLDEKLNVLAKYDAVQPCTQKRASNLLKIPQSSLSDLLRTRTELIGNSDMKHNCRVVLTDCKSQILGKRPQQAVSILRKPPPPRKRCAPKRFDFDSVVEVDTSDEDYGPSEDSSDSEVSSESSSTHHHKLTPKQETIFKQYLKLKKSTPRSTQRDAAQKLGVSQSTLSNLLKAAGMKGNKRSFQVLESVKERKGEEGQQEEKDELQLSVRHHKMKTLKEKIEIFRMFDAMQPCSQNKARDIFKISSSTLSGLIANREAIEGEFRQQVVENCQVLKTYDALQPHQLTRAHLICGMTKARLAEVLENRKFWEEEAASHSDVTVDRKPPSMTEMERIENELLIWYQSHHDEEITWKQLMSKARELSKTFGSTFVPTDPWMSKWKRKISHLISKARSDTTPMLATVNCVDDETATVLPALKDYHPNDIFNLDETALYYRAMPGCAPGNDDWVTVLFACNMSGTEKKRLTVVGKSEAPLFFGILSLPLSYEHSDDSRMTEEILSKFLEDWNVHLESNKRNIALILDNCSLHMNVAYKFERIRMFFVSNNSSNPSQPLNRGIITHTKTLFREKLFSTVYKLVDDRKAINDLVCKITLLDSLYMLAEAWEEVPVKIIIKAFAELVFPNLSQPHHNEEPKEDIDRLNQLDDDLLNIDHSDEGRRECLEDELSNEEYMVVHVEGVVDPSDDEFEGTAAGGADSSKLNSVDCGTPNTSGLESELRQFLDSTPTFVESSRSTKKVPGVVKVENILAESLCNDLGLANSLEKEPPTPSEVHGALGVIKRFLRMNGGTLEDFTDFTQLEMKVLSKIKS